MAAHRVNREIERVIKVHTRVIHNFDGQSWKQERTITRAIKYVFQVYLVQAMMLDNGNVHLKHDMYW